MYSRNTYCYRDVQKLSAGALVPACRGQQELPLHLPHLAVRSAQGPFSEVQKVDDYVYTSLEQLNLMPRPALGSNKTHRKGLCKVICCFYSNNHGIGGDTAQNSSSNQH